MSLSEEGQMIVDVARRILSDIPMATFDMVEAGEWPAALWSEIEEAGLPLALIGEEHGGFGLPVADGLELVRLTGSLAVPVPLAETMIANWFLARAGIAVVSGPVAFTDSVLAIEGGRLVGEVAGVAWARHCATVALAVGTEGNRLVRLPHGSMVAGAVNIAGEPRDTIAVAAPLKDYPSVSSLLSASDLHIAGAAMRALQLAGAIETTMAMTLQFVQDRSQFGRALGAFQVIQHQIAQLAGETAAARVAGDMVAEVLGHNIDPDAVGAAKVRTGEAASKIAAAAHQLHGAMGFTREHRLHLYTRRLWAWRDEFGGESEWSATLGKKLAPHSRDVWRALTQI